MKDLLLIKKINPLEEITKVFPFTFQLDEKFTKKEAMEIFCGLKSKGIIAEDEFLIKDKTFTVIINSKDTTQVIKEILARNLDIYGVYIPYGDLLEKGEINE
ncbi:hypothetical protein [uncultured Anaerococcus sp.]|uniref:hypothetical protein n=1 Tax=uncultured Anaerococcus sp. TaxID=293428 RepID=UPI00288998D4|nr:hypothetical protein [uncultured Anaerococcus sp.]